MDSRTRVESALSLDMADRPPVGWWGHTFVEEWSPESLARVTIERARRFGWDYVKFQPRASSFAEAFGADYAPSGNRLEGPRQTGRVRNEPADWEGLGLVNPRALDDQVEGLRRVVSELGPSVPVIQTVFSPPMVAGYLAGEDRGRVLEHLREYPDVVVPAFQRIGQALSEFAASSVEAGAAGIFYAISGFAGDGMTSAGEYEDLFIEHDRRILESLPSGAWFNVLHLCGTHVHFGLAKDLPVGAVSWAIHDNGNPTLAQGRDRSGKAVMGGLARHATLLDGTPEAVKQEGSEALRETGGKGLLLAPGCSVPVAAPEGNLLAISLP